MLRAWHVLTAQPCMTRWLVYIDACMCGYVHCHVQVCEGRLYSEGLHVLGAAPGPAATAQFLSAYMGDRLPLEVVESLAFEGFQQARGRLEAAWSAPPAQKEGAAGAGAGADARTGGAAALREAQEVAALLARNTEVRGSAGCAHKPSPPLMAAAEVAFLLSCRCPALMDGHARTFQRPVDIQHAHLSAVLAAGRIERGRAALRAPPLTACTITLHGMAWHGMGCWCRSWTVWWQRWLAAT